MERDSFPLQLALKYRNAFDNQCSDTECHVFEFGFVPNDAHAQRISSTGSQSRYMEPDVNKSPCLPIDPHVRNID